jgi:hypothetical protein
MSTPEESIPQRTIRRNSTKHARVLVDGTAPDSPLPWSDEGASHQRGTVALNSDARMRQRYYRVVTVTLPTEQL